MSYADSVKEYLCEYKNNILKIDEPGIYKHQGIFYEYHHILPAKLGGFLNILESYRLTFFGSGFDYKKLHRYFHHLNSSQALCINLFYPLLKEGKLSLILDQLGFPEQDVIEEKSCFEKESDLEKDKDGKNRRKTNFDFFMKLKNGTKIYFEIKYTENEFGKTDPDEYAKHVDKFKSVYKKLLNDNKFITQNYHDKDEFLKNYQIMRNLCHITDDSYVVFVYPEANNKIHKQIQYAASNILTPEGNKRFRAMTLETLIPALRENVATSSNLSQHYTEFSKKYDF